MSTEREQLIRRSFEAYRDLVWFENLEPKFRQHGVDGKEMQSFREAWNEHAEIRDWAWWQKESEHTHSGQLHREIMDITDRLDALGCLKWQQEQNQRLESGERDFGLMIAEAADHQPANDNEKGLDR